MSRPDGLEDLCEGDWASFHARLADVLRGMLYKDNFDFDLVNLEVTTVPPEELPPPPSQFRWLLRGRRGLTQAPLLTIMRLEDSLYLQCAGPAEDGGYVSLSSQQRAMIESLGWRQSQRKDRHRWGYPNYRAYFPAGPFGLGDPGGEPQGPYAETINFADTAQFTIDTLRGPLGARTPRDLRVL